MRKAALHNLGCKVNSYETEAMGQLLERAGYELVDFSEKADVYLVNTCSVTNIADRKSRQMLHRARKMNPKAVVVAAGCYVQAAGEKLKQDGTVDIFIGNNKKTELAALLEEYFSAKGETGTESVIDIGSTGEYENLSVERLAGRTRAFIKIQDGCNQFCSYCIIPYTRGRVRSRRQSQVEEEVRRLAEGGCLEVVLTGIHLSSYGVDFPKGEETDLLKLIEKLHQIEGITRIRLGSLEPRIVTEAFAFALAALPKVCPHFHLSLQSGCDRTLKRMNRHYDTARYLECCKTLRKAFEHPAITTDVIVGFPGETREEFEETRAYLKQVGFYEMHIFKYSRRDGTKAALLPEQVPESVKGERSRELLDLEEEMSLEYRKSFLGKTVLVLLEEEYEWESGRYLAGYTKEYVRAVVPYEPGLAGTFVKGICRKMLGKDEVFL